MRFIICALILFSSSWAFALNDWVYSSQNTRIHQQWSEELRVSDDLYDYYLSDFESICAKRYEEYKTHARELKLAYRLTENTMPKVGEQRRGRLTCEFLILVL